MLARKGANSFENLQVPITCGRKDDLQFLQTEQIGELQELKPNSKEGRNLKAVDVLILDEVSMYSYRFLEVIDTVLQDLLNNREPFGGKSVLLDRDFRQLLPMPLREVDFTHRRP